MSAREQSALAVAIRQRSLLGSRSLRIVGRFGIVVALIAMVVVGTLLSPVFLTPENLLNVARNVALVGIVATGMTFVVVSGSFVDLSVPAIILAASIVTMVVQPTVGFLGSIVAGLATGALFGLANGSLVGLWRANPVIVTIATGAGVVGVAQALVGGAIIYSEIEAFTAVARGNTFGFPTVVLILLAVALAAHLVLRRTVYGRWAYATGGNYSAAETSGVPTRRIVLVAFIVSGIAAAAAGVLLGSLIGHARVGMGDGYEFDAIAAVALGGTSLFGGAGGVPRTLLGVLIIGVLNNLMILLGIPNEAQGMLKGTLIVGAVGLDVLLRRVQA